MAHPVIDNPTGFAFEPLFVTGQAGEPLLVALVKVTYSLRTLPPELAEAQYPVRVAGEARGAPEPTSYKYEPEFAWMKPATDVVLIGHARAPNSHTTTLDVGFRVGPVQQRARVYGARMWYRAVATISHTAPQPFEKIPLIYERAFGGADPSVRWPDGSPACDPRNPVGVGYHDPKGTFVEEARLPNLESLQDKIQQWGDRPAPVGFGFTSCHWQPRAQFAGTYDETWLQQVFPVLPADFDLRYFQGAPEALVYPGRFRGGEPVEVRNAAAVPELAFPLPCPPALEVTVVMKGRTDQRCSLVLDTVVINTDDDVLLFTLRGHCPLRTGPHDVDTIRVRKGEA